MTNKYKELLHKINIRKEAIQKVWDRRFKRGGYNSDAFASSLSKVDVEHGMFSRADYEELYDYYAMKHNNI